MTFGVVNFWSTPFAQVETPCARWLVGFGDETTGSLQVSLLIHRSSLDFPVLQILGRRVLRSCKTIIQEGWLGLKRKRLGTYIEARGLPYLYAFLMCKVCIRRMQNFSSNGNDSIVILLCSYDYIVMLLCGFSCGVAQLLSAHDGKVQPDRFRKSVI